MIAPGEAAVKGNGRGGEWENGRMERWKGGRMEPEDRRQNNPSNSEPRTRPANRERRTANGERRTANGERRTANGEWQGEVSEQDFTTETQRTRS
jgi:hypothetical protein